MIEEKKIKSDFNIRFGIPFERMRTPRDRRIFVDLEQGSFRPVFEHAVNDLGFKFLSAITGLDEGASFGVIYHMSGRGGIALNLKFNFPKDNPSIKTVTDYFMAADIYERELIDLFGIKVEGLPEGRHYPLPDDWPKGQYPLRKDWRQNA